MESNNHQGSNQVTSISSSESSDSEESYEFNESQSQGLKVDYIRNGEKRKGQEDLIEEPSNKFQKFSFSVVDD